MPTEILMPALSPTMTEGTLATWQKKEGDKVEPGDVIAEIETDKATMEVEAVDEGTLGRILVPAGSEGVAVNTPIGLLLGEGEDEAALDQAPQGGGGQPTDAADAPAEATPAPAPEEAAPAAADASAPAAPTTASGERIFASPLARRLAQAAGLELARIEGSGPRGRIVKADIERAQAEGTGKAAPAPERAPAAEPAAEPTAAPRAEAAPAAAPAAAPGAGFPPPSAPHEVFALDNMRKTIAKRLGEAKREIPHFYVTADVEIDALLRLRAELNGRADADYKLSVNDFVVKACAIALRRVPAANAMFGGDKIFRLTDVDVAVAVALEGGLITPVLRRVDGKGLATLSNEMKELASRARAGKLMPEEYQGGAFCVSNLGMYGVKDFAAIINPPQAGILAVGVGEQRPVVKDGAIAVATVMTTTLSVDHRVVDGAVAADMMRHIKAILEDPLALLL